MSDEGADEQEEEEVDHVSEHESLARRGCLSVVCVCRQRVVGWECVCGSVAVAMCAVMLRFE